MKIILGFSNEEITSKIKYLLMTNEIGIFTSYSSFKDLQEGYANYDDLIIICQYKFHDGSILDIENKNSKNSYIICISNRLYEEFTDNLNSFLLRTPIDVKLLTTLTKMLININDLSSNVKEENTIYIDKSKEILIRDFSFSEDTAHKFLQRLSMNLCINKNYLCKNIYNSFSIY